MCERDQLIPIGHRSKVICLACEIPCKNHIQYTRISQIFGLHVLLFSVLSVHLFHT